jgi:AmmeMemoRadiSam system protein A
MSQQSEKSRPCSCADPSTSVAEFSPEERALLLCVAHKAIEAALAGSRYKAEPPTPHLAELRGAFTTLYLHEQLRGCVGYVFPIASVYQTVAETACAAAFDDNRFPPVTAPEAAELELLLSILSPLRPIRAEEVEVGSHGLMVTLGPYRGLLLPQVPVEHGWDRVTFLEQTCRKAGLPLDALQKGAVLEAFTAEIFGEGDR